MSESKPINPEYIKLLLYGLGGWLLYNRFFGKDRADREAEAASNAINKLPIDKNPLQTESYKPKPPAPNTIAFRTDKTTPAVPKTYFVDAARDIRDGFGFFNDDEAKIIRSIKKALTKLEVNLIARSYSALYKKDLFFDLNDKLNLKELAPIYKYINELPDTIKGKK